MIIKTHHKITLDITQIIDRHIQIHSQNCVVIYIPIFTYKMTKYKLKQKLNQSYKREREEL